MDELLKRYGSDKDVIIKYFDFLAKRTRKSGKISGSVKKNQLIKWQKYNANIVIAALRIYMSKNITVSMNEKYALGIIRNLAKESDDIESNKKCCNEKDRRYAEKFAALGSGNTECDF